MTEEVRYIKLNDVFKIELLENASTGYVWRLDGNDFTIVKTESEARYMDPKDVVGGKVKVLYHIKPNKIGELNLKIKCIRPWEKNSEPLQVYKETIMVEE